MPETLPSRGTRERTTGQRAHDAQRVGEAEKAFLQRLADAGARLAEGERYVNNNTPVWIVCAQKHRSHTRPRSSIGHDVCRICKGRDSASGVVRFMERICAAGLRLDDDSVVENSDSVVTLHCARKHSFPTTPAAFGKKEKCPLCVIQEKAERLAAERYARFMERVEEAGSVLAEGSFYSDRDTKVSLVCPEGHETSVLPVSVEQGGCVCAPCSYIEAGRRKRAETEGLFWERIAALGARAAEGAKYVNTYTLVELVCPGDHPCRISWDGLKAGRALCSTCTGTAPSVLSAQTEARFLARLKELGARLAPGASYQRRDTPVAVYCSNNHLRHPRPGNVLIGRGICGICSGTEPGIGEERFLAAVAAQGARLAPGEQFTRSSVPVALICANNHKVTPVPANVITGQGLCNICSHRSTEVAAAEFWAAVERLGGKPAPGAVYVDASTKVDLICANGHTANPKPTSLQRGAGLCHKCVAVYDRVYLLTHEDAAAIKVGVTSNAARVRDHQSRGYVLHAQWLGLDHDVVVAAEKAMIAHWRSAGILSVPTAPEDGITETAPLSELAAAVAFLTTLLGEPA